MSEAFRVVWFPPDRPVEGNTIYVRPVPDDVEPEPEWPIPEEWFA